MSKKIFIVCILIMLCAAPAFAERDNDLPHGKWWNNTEVASQLKLTDNEVKTLDDSYINHRRKLIKLRAQVEEEQFELNNLIDGKTLNDEAVFNQLKKLELARTNLSRERFNFFLDVRKLLGFDRYQQLKSMFQKMRHNRRYDRFSKKMNNSFDSPRKFRPSFYKDHNSSRMQDDKIGSGAPRPETDDHSSSDISPFNEPIDASEEAL